MTKNSILMLHQVFSENEEEVKKIINKKELTSSIDIHYSYGLVNKIYECFTGINKLVLSANNYLLSIYKQLGFLTQNVLGNHHTLNTYMLYDFLSVEYFRIYENIKNILNF